VQEDAVVEIADSVSQRSVLNNQPDFTKRTVPQQIPLPKCPHCDSQPLQLFAVQTTIGRMVCAVFMCSMCDKAISVAPVAMVEPPKSRIVVPGE
jgi:hypothetical protein